MTEEGPPMAFNVERFRRRLEAEGCFTPEQIDALATVIPPFFEHRWGPMLEKEWRYQQERKARLTRHAP